MYHVSWQQCILVVPKTSHTCTYIGMHEKLTKAAENGYVDSFTKITSEEAYSYMYM